METAKLRNMLHLQWSKALVIKSIFSVCLLFAASSSLFAQKEIYREEQDQKPYYYSLVLGTVVSRFQIEHHPTFLQQDSILVAEGVSRPGFRLGFGPTLRL